MPKKRDEEKTASQRDDYYASLCRQRAEFRTHLIGRIRGSDRHGESRHKAEMKICGDCETRAICDDDVCGETSAISCKADDDIADIWITEQDKNLLRYYYYILHEVDDAHAGTLDSDTLKKITGMVSAEWQERHDECLVRLIQEIKSDYVTNMKKSIVDFALQEPFEEAHIICAPVSLAFAQQYSWVCEFPRKFRARVGKVSESFAPTPQARFVNSRLVE